MPQNRQLKLAARPDGLPKPTDFTIEEGPTPELEDGQVLVKVELASLDPAMRGWMNEGRSYIPPVQLGEVMRALGAGRIVESRNPGFAPGDPVSGLLGLQHYAAVDGSQVRKLDLSYATLPQQLGVLGMTGMTAYFGLLDVGQPKAGETVVVSAAAGAVGSVVGQIARIKGCRAVGIAGGPDKCRDLVETLGFDAAVDYRAENFVQALREACPSGIDVYFDNVGGQILEACLSLINRKARVVICGAISIYNHMAGVTGPRNYMALLVNRARMEGFVVSDYAARYGEAVREMAGWMAEGRLKGREDIAEGGIEAYPEVFARLFTGANQGKLILKIADEAA